VSPARKLVVHDEPLAIALGAGVTVAGVVQGLGVLGVLGAVLLHVPLARRSRWPLGVLAAVAAASVVYLAFVASTPAFIPAVLVALYTVAANGTRRRTLLVTVGLVPAVCVVALAFAPADGNFGRQILELASQCGIGLAVGEAVRSHRALLGAMRERAERAEHDREREASRRVAEERVRIARDVHDVVAHSIATISTQASVGVHIGMAEPAKAVELLASIKEVSNVAMHDLRHALGVLRRPHDGGPTSPTPSLHDVGELVRQARSAGLPVVLRVEGSPAALPSAVQVAVYRIVQEGLTNVMRHAGGARARVTIAVAGGEVEVEVINDDAGAPTALSTSGTGAGLTGMRERAGALGGALQAGRAPGGGWRVHTTLPLDRTTA
jgi:signal transduction histidine kinase